MKSEKEIEVILLQSLQTFKQKTNSVPYRFKLERKEVLVLTMISEINILIKVCI